jgi:hypothetical protein
MLDPKRVRKLADGWNDLMTGVLTVSRRQEQVMDIPGDVDVTTDLIVLDGQTRLAAFRMVCGKTTAHPLTCQVYSGLTLQEEAAMFLEHNDRKAVHGRDRFRLANMAGEKWALDITDIAEHFGWVAEGSAERSSKLRRYKCLSTAERVYRADDGVALRRAFEVISNVWNGQADAVCTETLSGIGQLFIKHPDLEPKQVHGLVTKLRRLTVGSYIGEVTADKRRNGISIAQAAYLFTVGVYNRGRSEDHRI